MSNAISETLFQSARANWRFVALNKWQVEEIQKGIAEADCGEFASSCEVKRLLKRWTLPEKVRSRPAVHRTRS
jgi:predicted transcriptional regulator